MSIEKNYEIHKELVRNIHTVKDEAQQTITLLQYITVADLLCRITFCIFVANHKSFNRKNTVLDIVTFRGVSCNYCQLFPHVKIISTEYCWWSCLLISGVYSALSKLGGPLSTAVSIIIMAANKEVVHSQRSADRKTGCRTWVHGSFSPRLSRSQTQNTTSHSDTMSVVIAIWEFFLHLSSFLLWKKPAIHYNTNPSS